MSALEVFGFDGADIRVVLIDGKPRFVARDVAVALGYADPTSAVKQHCKGVAIHHPLQTAGGVQTVRVIGEGDLLRLVTGSRLPSAERFERWAFDEVLPSVVRTGSYTAPESREQLLARAVLEASAAIAEKDEHIAVLTPRAEAWDELADAGTDYAVRDAAQILNRAGVQTGPQRLFDTLSDLRWIYRGEKHRWTAYARAVDAGYIRARAMPPYVNGDGDLIPAAPQIRVTARGLERLRVRLGALTI